MVVDTAISIAADHGSRSVQLSVRSVQYHEPRPSINDPATAVQQIKTAVAAATKAAEEAAAAAEVTSSAKPGLAFPDPLQQIPVRLVTQSSGSYLAPPSMSKEDPDGSYAVWFSYGVSERDVNGV